jgi:hypothetical protein
MDNKFKMLIELRIKDNNIVKVEEIIHLLLQNNAISLSDYSDVLTANMCYRDLRAPDEEEEELPSNVISIFEAKSRCL